jgi:hypothetical protein
VVAIPLGDERRDLALRDLRRQRTDLPLVAGQLKLRNAPLLHANQ